MTRPLLTFVIVTQLEILVLLIAVIVLAARVDAASRSAESAIPATSTGPQQATDRRELDTVSLSWALPSPSGMLDGQRPSPSVATRIPEPLLVARRPVSTRSSMKGAPRGWASWYAADGLIAAVHSWRWGTRPYYIRVCTNNSPAVMTRSPRCIRVLVQDACAGCTGSRLIDLSDDAFRLLAPLSQGIVKVSVTQW